jgi:hypothetical protein
MTNVMHKFLIYLSIFFYVTCFGLSLSLSSQEGVQYRQWFKSPGYGVSARDADTIPRRLGSHTIRHTHPIGPLYTSDQLGTEAATYTTRNIQKGEHPCR